jgi:hypothetical protein
MRNATYVGWILFMSGAGLTLWYTLHVTGLTLAVVLALIAAPLLLLGIIRDRQRTPANG